MAQSKTSRTRKRQRKHANEQQVPTSQVCTHRLPVTPHMMVGETSQVQVKKYTDTNRHQMLSHKKKRRKLKHHKKKRRKLKHNVTQKTVKRHQNKHAERKLKHNVTQRTVKRHQSKHTGQQQELTLHQDPAPARPKQLCSASSTAPLDTEVTPPFAPEVTPDAVSPLDEETAPPLDAPQPVFVEIDFGFLANVLVDFFQHHCNHTVIPPMTCMRKTSTG